MRPGDAAIPYCSYPSSSLRTDGRPQLLHRLVPGKRFAHILAQKPIERRVTVHRPIELRIDAGPIGADLDHILAARVSAQAADRALNYIVLVALDQVRHDPADAGEHID